MIYLRGVLHDDILSDLIIKNQGGILGHFEGVMKGGTVIGAFAEGGVQERLLDYDGGKFKYEILFELPADDDMSARFEHYLRSPEVLGERYDYLGIVNQTHPGFDLHGKHTVFCSALIHDDLRWIKWWPRELPIPGHYVTPIILHQELLIDQRVRIVTRDDPAFLAHIAKNV